MGKKEDFYKARETHYQERDGEWKPFTIIDHDVKTSTSKTSKGKTKETIEREEEEYKQLKASIIADTMTDVECITQLPVVFAALDTDDFVSAALYAEVIIKDGDTSRWDGELLKGLGQINKGFISTLLDRVWKFWIIPEYHDKDPVDSIRDGSYKEWLK